MGAFGIVTGIGVAAAIQTGLFPSFGTALAAGTVVWGAASRRSYDAQYNARDMYDTHVASTLRQLHIDSRTAPSKFLRDARFLEMARTLFQQQRAHQASASASSDGAKKHDKLHLLGVWGSEAAAFKAEVASQTKKHPATLYKPRRDASRRPLSR